jgi:hypothetical protein
MALLLLQQTGASSRMDQDGGQGLAADAMVATAAGVSNETSGARIQASSKIFSGQIKASEKQDGAVQAALEYLDSDKFHSSDPAVKDTLKKLMSENGPEFLAKVSAEKSKNGGISTENAIVNAISETIRDNRDQFSAGEFVIGFKLTAGGSIMSNIADVNGNSTYQSLMDAISADTRAFSEAIRSGATEFAGALTTNHQEMKDWTQKWAAEFGFELG